MAISFLSFNLVKFTFLLFTDHILVWTKSPRLIRILWPFLMLVFVRLQHPACTLTSKYRLGILCHRTWPFVFSGLMRKFSHIKQIRYVSFTLNYWQMTFLHLHSWAVRFNYQEIRRSVTFNYIMQAKKQRRTFLFVLLRSRTTEVTEFVRKIYEQAMREYFPITFPLLEKTRS